MESVRTDVQHNSPNSNLEQIAAEWPCNAKLQIERCGLERQIHFLRIAEYKSV